MARSNHQKHQAGRHLAVAEALLRGYSASLEGPQAFVKIKGRQAGGGSGRCPGCMDDCRLAQGYGASIDFYVLVDVTDGRRNF
ncbi:hypothetical protein ACIBM8_21975 [Micromonospora aurantiaca]|uniref:hypothetical protein n=1 Tax=Micromonospora aurantiaca (nom. illeg.) TaxID=47850 RepID=UPI0037ABDFC0